MTGKDNFYATCDAYLAGFLVLKGFKCKFVSRDGGQYKFGFNFQNTEKLQQTILNYQDGAQIEALAFAKMSRKLHNRSISILSALIEKAKNKSVAD